MSVVRPRSNPSAGTAALRPDEDSPPPSMPEPELEAAPEPEPEPDPAFASDTEAPTTETDDGGVPGWLLPVTVVVLLGGVGLLLFGRRGRTDA